MEPVYVILYDDEILATAQYFNDHTKAKSRANNMGPRYSVIELTYQ